MSLRQVTFLLSMMPLMYFRVLILYPRMWWTQREDGMEHSNLFMVHQVKLKFRKPGVLSLQRYLFHHEYGRHFGDDHDGC